MILKLLYFVFLFIYIQLISLEVKIQYESKLDREISWIHCSTETLRSEFEHKNKCVLLFHPIRPAEQKESWILLSHFLEKFEEYLTAITNPSISITKYKTCTC